ncbi:MAG: hypothetical protein IJ189_11530 [Clostridia bacterium]|nr:hypothetical protein [Clostridia bacterium]
MRKFLFCLACLMLLMTASALADTYTFNEIYASVDIPNDYEVVLTPYNLSSNASWMETQGMDYDATLNEFEAEGILLKAYDAENNRIFVLTALNDLDGQTYFDLNNQDESMRKEFRTNHTNGIGYSTLGYAYSSAKWANYKGTTLRFLQTKYTLRQEGEQVCSGYQRRTIRNGYTITLDMQVRGRAAKDTDNTALEKIMKTFAFSQILPMPEVPVKLTVSSTPPTETNDDTFTIKGTTGKNAKVNVTVISLGSGGSKNYNVIASGSGVFSVKVTLPGQGVYSVTLTSETEGAKVAQRLYSVTYRKGMLPVDVTLSPGEDLGDSTTISGSTVRGASIQLSVSGPITYNKKTTNSNFKFTVDTSAAGTYQFVLAVTKKGLEDRVFTYTASRTYSEVEMNSKLRSSAKKVTYAQLTKNVAEGKAVSFSSYITAINPSINEWVLTVATTKSGNTYKNSVYVICKEEPSFSENDKIKVIGTYSGKYSVLDADGNIKTYPRVDAIIVEAD